MLTPFLKYVSEGKVIRRHSDLQRYTFPEVTERIYLSYLRTWEDHYRNLTHLERALNIQDANLKNIRRAVANYTKLDSKMKMQTLHRLQQQLQAKLPNTDILKKFKEL
jgi:hypothetical protein